MPKGDNPTSSMIGAIRPSLASGAFIFCTTSAPDKKDQDYSAAVGMFLEAEGISLILPLSDAERLGFDCDLPMRLISLRLNSKLDAVGLTAAIATELAAFGIPCNVVAAYHHDHIFVPEPRADEALRVLNDLQSRHAGSCGINS